MVFLFITVKSLFRVPQKYKAWESVMDYLYKNKMLKKFEELNSDGWPEGEEWPS